MTSYAGGLHFQKWVSWNLGLSLVFSSLVWEIEVWKQFWCIYSQAGGKQECHRSDLLAPWGRVECIFAFVSLSSHYHFHHAQFLILKFFFLWNLTILQRRLKVNNVSAGGVCVCVPSSSPPPFLIFVFLDYGRIVVSVILKA